MLQNAIVTVGAGLAGMLLFIVSLKGSFVAVAVMPLPIMIAALGWSQMVGLAAALLGAAIIAIVFHPALAAGYAAAFALPAWWLSYLVMLARFDSPTAASSSRDAKVEREWYPIGRVAFAAAIAVSVAVGIGVLSISFSNAGYERAARSAAAEVVPLVAALFGGSERMPSGVSIKDVAFVVIRIMPIAAAASLILLHLVNLWLAGRTVEMSHRLGRPWPSLPENLRLPRLAGVIFFVAIAVAVVVGGYPGLFAAIVAAALAAVLALQGLAVLHALMRTRRARRTILAAIYGAVVLLMPWPLILFAILGLVDLALSLRDRIAAPPAPLDQ